MSLSQLVTLSSLIKVDVQYLLLKTNKNNVTALESNKSDIPFFSRRKKFVLCPLTKVNHKSFKILIVTK